MATGLGSSQGAAWASEACDTQEASLSVAPLAPSFLLAGVQTDMSEMFVVTLNHEARLGVETKPGVHTVRRPREGPHQPWTDTSRVYKQRSGKKTHL